MPLYDMTTRPDIPSGSPLIRYRHDADELHRLADWLDRATHADALPRIEERMGLDYFRLADALLRIAYDARQFAQTMAGPLP